MDLIQKRAFLNCAHIYNACAASIQPQIQRSCTEGRGYIKEFADDTATKRRYMRAIDLTEKG
jgi:hypothetical protein